MRKLLHFYKVDPSFLRIIFSFGEEPHLAESSSSFLSLRSEQDGHETEISYQLNYVEENRRNGQDPWSYRHAGVYHRHTPNFDMFILLHPVKSSILEDRVLSALGLDLVSTSESDPVASKTLADPYCLQTLVLCSFLDNWRWYFRYLGEKFTTAVSSSVICPHIREAHDFDRTPRLWSWKVEKGIPILASSVSLTCETSLILRNSQRVAA